MSRTIIPTMFHIQLGGIQRRLQCWRISRKACASCSTRSQGLGTWGGRNSGMASLLKHVPCVFLHACWRLWWLVCVQLLIFDRIAHKQGTNGPESRDCNNFWNWCSLWHLQELYQDTLLGAHILSGIKAGWKRCLKVSAASQELGLLVDVFFFIFIDSPCSGIEVPKWRGNAWDLECVLSPFDPVWFLDLFSRVFAPCQVGDDISQAVKRFCHFCFSEEAWNSHGIMSWLTCFPLSLPKFT